MTSEKELPPSNTCLRKQERGARPYGLGLEILLPPQCELSDFGTLYTTNGLTRGTSHFFLSKL